MTRATEGDLAELCKLSFDCLTELRSLRNTHPNVLLEGSEAATEEVFLLLKPHLREPIVWKQLDAPLELRDDQDGTLALPDVAALDGDEQNRLLRWLEDGKPRAQIVSTSTTPLFSLVERGLFDAALYYRLNVVFLQVSERGDDDPLPWFAPEVGMELRDTSAIHEVTREARPDGGSIMEALSAVEKRLAALDERSKQTEERLITLGAVADAMTIQVEEMLSRIELLAAQVSAQLAQRVIGKNELGRDARRLAKELQIRTANGFEKRPAFGRWASVLVTLGVLISVVVMRSAGETDRTDTPSRVAQEQSSRSTSSPPSTLLSSSISAQPVPTTGEDPPKPPLRTPARRPPEFVGTLVLQSDPSGAAVFLDGRLIGTTPLQLLRVRAGSHAVWVEREGYRRWTASILVPAEQRTPIDVKLERQDK